MASILYHNSVSPPSRLALLAIRNLGLDIQINVLDIYKGEQNSPEYLKINPLHQVPVLVDGDYVLTESRAIACYLANTKRVNSPLYPTDPKARAFIESRLYFDATNSFPTIRDFARPVLRAGAKTIPQSKRDDVVKLLETLESFLAVSKWFAGDTLTLADLGFLVTVGTIKNCGADLSKYPKLNVWYENCRTLPGFDENEEGAKKLADTLRSLLEEPLWK